MTTKTRDDRIKELARMTTSALDARGRELGYDALSLGAASKDELIAMILDAEGTVTVNPTMTNPIQRGFTDAPAGTEWCRRKPGSGVYHTTGFCRSFFDAQAGEYVWETCEGNES